MDLDTVTSFRFAHTRADLVLLDGEQLLGGGTWLLSEPQVPISGLVDLSTMDWPSIEYPGDGLRIGATCTIAELAQLAPRPGWRAHPLLFQCASALLASHKIWNAATVGGNICRSFAAAGMVSLCAGLDAVALVWQPGGGEYRIQVAELVTGNGTNSLGTGEVLRSVEIGGAALRARTAFRKIALAELGRSAAVLTGRVDSDGTATFVITAATERPAVLRYPQLPDATGLRSDVEAVEGYYTDPLGSLDWRRAVSAVLLEEIRTELAS